jgi:hypothetical protein
MTDPVAHQQTGTEQKKVHPVTVTVNGHEVMFADHRVMGRQIKQTAIEQGVPIQLDFVLFEVNPGGKLKQIGDDDTVTLRQGEELRAVAPDDNS